MPQTSEYFGAPLRNFAVGNANEFRNPGVVKAALAEFISTLIFVFAGTGSGLAYNKLTGNGPTSPSGLVQAALAHGFGLFVAVAVAFNISGGHVNPAVTFGLCVGGNITLLRAVLYIIAQLLGAVIACLLLVVSAGTWALPTFGVTGVSVWSAFLFEILLTFGLVYTVYATAADPKKGEIGILAPLAIGLIVAANILAAGPFSGAAMNPALAFGPALVSFTWAYHWIYWAGPLIGGALAGIVFEIFFISRSHEQVPGENY